MQHCWKKNQKLHSTLTFERNVVDAIAHQKLHHAQSQGKKKRKLPIPP